MKARERLYTIVYKKSTHYFYYTAVSNYDAADMLEKAGRPAWPSSNPYAGITQRHKTKTTLPEHHTPP
jgi:hypothetical protein